MASSRKLLAGEALREAAIKRGFIPGCRFRDLTKSEMWEMTDNYYDWYEDIGQLYVPVKPIGFNKETNKTARIFQMGRWAPISLLSKELETAIRIASNSTFGKTGIDKSYTVENKVKLLINEADKRGFIPGAAFALGSIHYQVCGPLVDFSYNNGNLSVLCTCDFKEGTTYVTIYNGTWVELGTYKNSISEYTLEMQARLKYQPGMKYYGMRNYKVRTVCDKPEIVVENGMVIITAIDHKGMRKRSAVYRNGQWALLADQHLIKPFGGVPLERSLIIKIESNEKDNLQGRNIKVGTANPGRGLGIRGTGSEIACGIINSKDKGIGVEGKTGVREIKICESVRPTNRN